MKIVVDHLAGARRGQRQVLAAVERVRFGRHPGCEVAVDANRDLDASARHAELRPPTGDGAAWVLVDVGSSNGTFVDGRRVTAVSIEPGVPTVVQLGTGGPRLRVFIGDPAQVAALPPVAAAAAVGPARWRIALVVVAAVAAATALGAWLA